MNGEIPSVPITTLAGIASLTDLLPEMPLPSPLPQTLSNKSLLFHPRVAEEAHILLSLRDEALVPQLVQSLVQTSADHIELKDHYAGTETPLEQQQNIPELLRAILHRNPNVFKGPLANSPRPPHCQVPSQMPGPPVLKVSPAANSYEQVSSYPSPCPSRHTPQGSPTPPAPARQSLLPPPPPPPPPTPIPNFTSHSHYCDNIRKPAAPVRVVNKVEETNSLVQELSQYIKEEEQVLPAVPVVLNNVVSTANSNSESKYIIPVRDRDNTSVNTNVSNTPPPSSIPRAHVHVPLMQGSSPAQASMAPVSQDKDTLVFDKRGGTQVSDSKLKEPVVMLNRIRPEDQALLQRSLKEFAAKSPSLAKEMGIVKNHHIESGSESEDEPRNKTKYFKARDKEREIQRQKEKDRRKKLEKDENCVIDGYGTSLTERIKRKRSKAKCIDSSEDNSASNEDSITVPKTKLRKVERKLVPVLEKLSVEELMETNTYQRFNRSIERIFNNTDDLDLSLDIDEMDDAPQETMIPKYQLQDLCSEAAKLKTLGAMESIPSERITRLLSILEKNIRDGAKVSLIADPNDDEDERKLWMELALERVMRAVDASLTTLYILTSPNMHKRVYLEDVIDRVVLFTKYQLHNTIYPAFDPVYRVDSKDKDGYVGSARKKRAHTKEVREKSVLALYNKLAEVVSLLGELLNIQTLTDTAVLHASSMGISPFFVEGVSELQLSALKLVTTIFMKYEKHRKLLLDDILASMARLPSSKRSLRSYRLSSEEHIQMLTALVLQLIQCMVVLPQNIKQNDPDTVIISKFNAARTTATNFLYVFLAKCSSKSEEIDYRPLFENFVQDLLTTVNKPEWPAAELMLSVLGKLLVTNFVNKNLEMTLRVASLDYLGVVAARLRKDAVVSHLKLSTIDQIINEIKSEELKDDEGNVKGEVVPVKNDEERTQFLQRVLLDYLAVRGQVEPALSHARHFYLAQWYQDNATTATTTTGASPIVNKANNKTNCKDVRKDSKRNSKRRNKHDGSSNEGESSTTEDEDDEKKKSKSVAEDVLENFRATESRKRFLISKIRPFEDSVSSDGMKTKVLQTYIDYDSAELVSRYLASKRPFSQSFDTYLKHILNVLAETSVLIRTKAMKCLTMIVEVDPGVLGLKDMQLGVKHSFLDHSTSVREAAVDLVGKFVLSRPELIHKYYEMLSARILDTGVSVRKRVIKILKDICMDCPDFPKIPEICVKMIRRVNDEDGIRKLVMEVFQNMWFTPVRERPSIDSEALLRKVMNITDVVAASGEIGLEWFEQLLLSLFKPKEDKDDSTKVSSEPGKALLIACKQIVDCLIENVLTLDGRGGGSSQRLVACLKTLYLFAKIRPQLLVDHAITLQPYLSLKCQTQGDYLIISCVARTLELVVPLIEHPSESFLARLEEDSVKLMMRQDPSVILSCVSCLGSVVNNVTRNFKLIRDCLNKYHGFLLRYKSCCMNGIGNDFEQQYQPAIRRSLYIVGLLMRFFDFIDKEVLGSELPVNIRDQVFDTFTYFLNHEEARFFTLKAVGSVCIRHYELMLGPDLKSLYHRLLKEEDAPLGLKVQVLNNIEMYLQEEERRMIKQDQEWAKLSKQENLKEMGDVSSGMASTVIQLYLKEILESFLHPHVSVRQAALKVIQLILSQGLVHPVQIVPYLICMSTDVEKMVSNSADKQLQEIEKKYPGFIHMKAQTGIRLSYKLQKILQLDKDVVRGFRVREGELPGALNGFLYSILRTKQQRRALVLSILKQFDEQVKTSLSQMLFLADNMAYFPYQVQDEPLFIIHHIDIMISVTGTNLLQSFREALIPLPSQQTQIDPITGDSIPVIDEEEDEDEEVLLSRVPDDTHCLQECITASQGCLLLLVLKQHLKTLYGFNDSKITQYSPSESAKVYEKAVNRKSNSRFNPKATLQKIQQGSPPPVLDESARRALISEYLEFKHLIMNLDPDESDDDDDHNKSQNTPHHNNQVSTRTSAAAEEKQPSPTKAEDIRVNNTNQQLPPPTESSQLQKVPKLTIVPPKPPDGKHVHHHRSHKNSRKTERHKKHHHKRKKAKLRSSEDESDEDYSDPDFLV